MDATIIQDVSTKKNIKERNKMSFHHIGINDLIYGIGCEKAIEVLSRDFDFPNPQLIDLLKMLEILKFYEDKDFLIEEYKNKIMSFDEDIKQINKIVGTYFENLYC